MVNPLEFIFDNFILSYLFLTLITTVISTRMYDFLFSRSVLCKYCTDEQYVG